MDPARGARAGPVPDRAAHRLRDGQRPDWPTRSWGGLQVFTKDDKWRYIVPSPGALLVNVGDLLARWTNDRWRSTLHRVMPPQPEAPGEDLLSLIFFYETNHDAVIESLPAPIGHTRFPPVVAHEYLNGQARRDHRRLAAPPPGPPSPGGPNLAGHAGSDLRYKKTGTGIGGRSPAIARFAGDPRSMVAG